MNPTPYNQTGWSLADLFSAPDGADLEAAFVTLEAQMQAFESVREQLRSDLPAAEFLGYVQQLETLTLGMHRLNYYPSLRFAENTQDQNALTLMARVEQFTAELANRSLFFELWWKALPEAEAERLMAESGDRRYWLESLRMFRPHTLSEAEEKIINLKNVTGASALSTLYDTLTNRYTFHVTVDGSPREMTRGELMSLVRQADPDLRAQAYQELYRVYGQDGPILGQIYQTLVRDWRSEQVQLRKFSSPIAARNLANDIPDAVVDTLLSVTRQNTGLFQRFFRLKARLLGMERLRRYDIYAPVVQSDKTYAFPQAAEMVFSSFREFDPQFAQLAERVFAENHLDSQVRKGKRGGAFCATAAPTLTPWVLVNYQGRADDVATLAHELGHAIHSMLASHHSVFTAHACLPLAETASTFGEMMLVDRLLSSEDDPNVRRDLLFRQMDDAYATIQRQAFFALFERQAHGLIQEGASVDALAEAYLENLREQFGEAVEVADEFRWEWVSIPHIYNVPFYVYAYSFGQLLVLSLYQQFQQEGQAFKPRYRRILEAGGSVAPVKLLAEAGIDIYAESFWQGGYAVLSRTLDQLEKLA
ncbi:M3 family oligoendopeptidase [Levilinea saccharolytica]|uniref:M3 family oligoendopeptidase n=1 Tax=Levilinea saccharolytica TaxID=229921 RepID=UPI000786289C|nr:M3 family oligoendopeptidase [Levilinea saccharolytica]GAP16210.1 oligoendopeptidase F [Levilinea saccharolytica]